MNKPLGHCDYCGNVIITEKDNYAGYFEDYCCKKCNDAADVEWDKHPLF